MPDPWIHDHLGDETTPRPGFADELAESLRRAWQSGADAPARVALDAREPARRRRRWPLVAGTATAAALLAVLTAVAITRDDGSAPQPAEPAPTTAPPVPTASAPPPTGASSAPPSTDTTAATSTPPTTVPPVATVPTALVPTDAPEGFFPACADRAGTPGSARTRAPETFGPLQVAPALTIHLPAALDPAAYPAHQRVSSPRTSTVVVPGGVLTVLTQLNGTAAAVVAVVNLDGSVRWVRCTGGSDLATGGVVTIDGGAAAFIQLGDRREGGTAERYTEIDLATGTLGPTLDERLGTVNPDLGSLPPLTVVDSSPTHLLLATARQLTGPDDVAVFVDRTTLEAVRLPGAGASPTNVQWPAFDDSGRPSLGVDVGARRRLVGVYADGAWVADDAVLAAAVTRVGFDPTVQSSPLQALDGIGGVRWEFPELTDPGDEGFRTTTTGAVTIARGCFDTPREPGTCAQPGLVGLRSADGTELWRLTNPQDGSDVLSSWTVGPAADGHALLHEPATADGTGGAWVLIEAATGRFVDGQRWPDPSTFRTGCCGEYDVVHTALDGGAVVAVAEREVKVWLPADSPVTPATAILP